MIMTSFEEHQSETVHREVGRLTEFNADFINFSLSLHTRGLLSCS